MEFSGAFRIYAAIVGSLTLLACQPSKSNNNIDASVVPDGSNSMCGGDTEVCCANQICESGLACVSNVCAPAVTPGTCVAGAPPWAFVSEVAPPTTLAPYQQFTMSVTFRNCTGATVARVDASAATGTKLGFSAPRDYDTFGIKRAAFPADVPNASTVTIAMTLRAPPLTGAHTLRFGLVTEGVAWLPAESPQHVVNVQATSQVATICPGVTADVGGTQPASDALQSCIDATPSGGTLALPGGVYRVDKGLRFANPITVTTTGSTATSPNCWALGSPACAVLRADANLVTPRGFVFVSAASGVHLDRIVIDGNRNARLASTAAASCAATNTGAGFNAHSDNCADCSFRRGMSARALCGTGWEWTGDNAIIEGNVFYQNGDHNASYMWADGLTLLRSNSAQVRNNQFYDNSDIDFICGGATNALLENNVVLHGVQGTFGGLMLDNFNSSTPGKFQGTLLRNNNVSCGNQLCDFGIVLGPHAWYQSPNIEGGTVTGNTVVGAKMQMIAEGAGTAADPIVVNGNTLGTSAARATFGCGQTRDTAVFNVSPDSFVTTADSTARFTYHDCP